MVLDKMYFDRNRYTDIITYSKTRVVLQNGVESFSSKDPAADYINACYMNSPFPAEGDYPGDRKIIASQGPLPQTTDHFWQMIIENNVTCVVSTCNIEEQGRAKCNKFWPDPK